MYNGKRALYSGSLAASRGNRAVYNGKRALYSGSVAVSRGSLAA
jgi:hypothetical protein